MVRDKERLRRFVAQHILFHVLPFMLADVGGIADDDVPKRGILLFGRRVQNVLTPEIHGGP